MGVTHNTSSRISSFILSFICPVSLNYSCFKNTQIFIYLLILSCLLFSLQAYLSLFLCLSSNISRHLKKDQDGFRRLSKVNFWSFNKDHITTVWALNFKGNSFLGYFGELFWSLSKFWTKYFFLYIEEQTLDKVILMTSPK